MAVEIAPKVKKATVTFTTQAGDDASQVILKGDWDNWEGQEMKKNSDGTFSAKLSIDLGKSYQFGYLIDEIWTTDPDFPLAASPFGTNNSILDLANPGAEKAITEKAVAEKKSAPKRKPPVKKR